MKCPCDASHLSRLTGNLLLLSPGIKHITGLLALSLPGVFWRGCKSLMLLPREGGEEVSGCFHHFSDSSFWDEKTPKHYLQRLFRARCCWTSAGLESVWSQLMVIPVWLHEWLGHGNPFCPLTALGREDPISPHSQLPLLPNTS